MKKQKGLLIDATGGSSWIGGLYYKKNIIYSLLNNDWIRSNCKIVLITEENNVELFREYENSIRIKTIKYKNIQEKKIKLMFFSKIYGCNYVYPSIGEKACRIIGVLGINWIPDFQHLHLPENFSKELIDSRNESFQIYHDSSFPLVLSSQDALNDFRENYGSKKKNVYVVPFVSNIEKELDFSSDYIKEVCDKYGLRVGHYAMVVNQFWKHKNHVVVLKAIEDLRSRPEWDDSFRFVFTGKLNDDLTDDYSSEIRTLLNKESIKEVTSCLGFVDRKEQLALMRGARMLIQPSLFEGWGTGLEDAKVLDKSVILSDIPVHREQMNEKCVLFDPYDVNDLEEKIICGIKHEQSESLEHGLSRMRENARIYSKEFERLLKEN